MNTQRSLKHNAFVFCAKPNISTHIRYTSKYRDKNRYTAECAVVEDVFMGKMGFFESLQKMLGFDNISPDIDFH